MSRPNTTCKQSPNLTQLLEAEIYGKRRAMGISQYALAEKIGITRNCIQQIECYQHLPKIGTVLDIMMALGFDEEERKAFLGRYMEAHYKDGALQKAKELAEAV